jgi:hypothetical protein
VGVGAATRARARFAARDVALACVLVAVRASAGSMELETSVRNASRKKSQLWRCPRRQAVETGLSNSICSRWMPSNFVDLVGRILATQDVSPRYKVAKIMIARDLR